MLKHISPIIGDKQERDLRGRLSIGGDDAVSAEWEVVVIYSLSFVGTVGFPQNKAGIGSPDILFTPHDVPRETVIIEVTAVSDAGAEDKNHFEYFLDEMRKAMRKHGLESKGVINFSLGYTESVKDGIRLTLPPKDQISTFCLDLAAKIKANPSRQSTFEFECNGTNSVFQFAPGSHNSSGQYGSYRSITSLTNNAISRRLEKKHEQIKGSCLEYPSLVVLCDNDCHAMAPTFLDSGERGITKVVNLYLNGQKEKKLGHLLVQKGYPSQTNRLNGVLLLAFNETMRPDRTRVRTIVGSYIKNNRSDIRHSLSDQVVMIVGNSLEKLPPVKALPAIAKRTYWYPANYGGYQCSHGKKGVTVKLSLLTLQKLLSGEIAWDRFVEDHQRVVGQFQAASDEGRMISNITIEKCRDEDDDWVIFQFGEIDPTALFKRHSRKSA